MDEKGAIRKRKERNGKVAKIYWNYSKEYKFMNF